MRAPVAIDEGLLQECAPILPVPVAEDGTASMGDLTLADIALAGQYRECAKGKAGLIRAVREAMQERR